jgi:hypothetical protein
MSTESEIRLARYSQVEREADAFGRVIGVRRLKPSEQTKVAEFTSAITGYDEVTMPETGIKMPISHRLPLMIAAAVCEIDGVKIPFAKSRSELDSIYDKLDREGLAAASKAFGKFQFDEIEDSKEAAKN